MTITLHAFGRSLISRERGALVRENILGRLEADRRITLDFTDVRRASYSFVDELVGSLLTMRESGALVAVDVVGATETIRFHVAQCAVRRGDELAAA